MLSVYDHACSQGVFWVLNTPLGKIKKIKKKGESGEEKRERKGRKEKEQKRGEKRVPI